MVEASWDWEWARETGAGLQLGSIAESPQDGGKVFEQTVGTEGLGRHLSRQDWKERSIGN